MNPCWERACRRITHVRHQTLLDANVDAELSNGTCAVIRVKGLVAVTSWIRLALVDVSRTCDTKLLLNANLDAELPNATCGVVRVACLVHVTESIRLQARPQDKPLEGRQLAVAHLGDYRVLLERREVGKEEHPSQ